MIRQTLLSLLALTLFAATVSGQKRFDQDPKLNNLEHLDGYKTCRLGELGRVEKTGNGKQNVIMIAGAGFGGSVFDSLIKSLGSDFTFYTITLPGYDSTPAPPMPPPGTSYGELTWTKSVQKGIEDLITREKIEQPIVIGHWMVAGNVALQLAIDNPNKLRAAALISGRAKNMPVGGIKGPQFGNLKQRAQWVDQGMAPQWFKTVTRDTWDDNNYYPHDYSRNPIRGLQLWRQAANAPLSVHVRYLCESLAQDSTVELDQLKIPTLVVLPGFDDDLFVQENQDYMRPFCLDSWQGVKELSDMISVKTIEEARVFIMDDQPDQLKSTLLQFIDDLN